MSEKRKPTNLPFDVVNGPWRTATEEEAKNFTLDDLHKGRVQFMNGQLQVPVRGIKAEQRLNPETQPLIIPPESKK